MTKVGEMIKKLEVGHARRFILGSGKVRKLFTFKRIDETYFETTSPSAIFEMTLEEIIEWTTLTEFELV